MDDLQFILMTTAFGGRDITEYKRIIPNLHICTDYNHDAMGNFLNSMNFTDKPAIHLEDDAILCDNFVERVTEAVSQYPDKIINFFSLRSRDYEEQKPFLVPGSRYIGNVCFYLPAGYGPMIASHYDVWPGKVTDPTGYDLLMADWLKGRKESYVQWFPHLVNHGTGKSIINPRRPVRTDKRFEK